MKFSCHVASTVSASPDLMIRFGHASEGGRGRISEDFFGIARPSPDQVDSKGIVAAIADGISGESGGRVAAECTVRSVLSDYYATPVGWEIPMALDKVLSATNSWLQAQNKRNTTHEGMATTLSVLVLRGSQYCIAHVGDTRIYRLRDHVLDQLTTDHVWARRGMHHIVKRAIGLDEYLVMEYLTGELRTGDLFVLMSDGVWEVIGHELARDIIDHHDDPQQVAEAIVDKAVLVEHQYLPANDATAIAIRVDRCGAGDT